MASDKTTFTEIASKRPIKQASIGNAIKRERFALVPLKTGNLADSTVYAIDYPLMRSGKVTKVSALLGTKPAAGTNTIAVKKGGTGGTSLLSGASYDISGITAATPTDLALATDTTFTAGQALTLELSTGVQTTPGARACVVVEVEYDDF
jgi:hypothetical protein